MKSILMITGRADVSGGPEHVYRLVSGMRDRMEIHVACPEEEPYWTRFGEIVGLGNMVRIPRRKFSLTALSAILKQMKDRHVRTVHAHGRAAGLYGRTIALLKGFQCYYTPHGAMPVQSFKTLCDGVMEYVLSFFSTKIIAVSDSEKRNLLGICGKRDGIVTIVNGVSLPPLLESRERPGPPFPVIHVTRFVYQKNSELLTGILEALKKSGELERFRFLILGDGDGRAAFEQELRRAGVAAQSSLPAMSPASASTWRRRFA